ncbi:hypothetical protein GCM10011273_12490 [Asticcacaulis endophyticus]|uniref:Uncharacterized protein n=1 Tax=Asticcacaulis endophyticus TaxID=1395890 RepID=A0A918Q277_9CAUL|nr:hypothetical protein GCM10011273_12490 [Asticcacaulis endophyticus]
MLCVSQKSRAPALKNPNSSPNLPVTRPKTPSKSGRTVSEFNINAPKCTLWGVNFCLNRTSD